jgi:hypothetical protein
MHKLCYVYTKWTDTLMYLQGPGKTTKFLILIHRNLVTDNVKEMVMIQNTGISYSRQQNGMG